jgi:hypothetical protein
VLRQETPTSTVRETHQVLREAGKESDQSHRTSSVRRPLSSNSFGNTLSEHSSPFSVHGGPTEKPITVTKEHEEGLERMDKLSEFAPLHVSCRGDPYGRAVCADMTCMRTEPLGGLGDPR